MVARGSRPKSDKPEARYPATSSYVYNGLEQMVTRTTTAVGGPTGAVYYYYGLAGNLIGEGNATAIQREYIWLPQDAGGTGPSALPLALVTAVTTTPVISMVHADHLNRPIRMTSATKATVWSATWKPFGEPYALSGTIENNLRFPGQYFLIETGQAYNWHRTYDPTTGRYTQADPLRFVDGPSVYAYAGSSPFTRADLRGLRKISFGFLGEMTAGVGFGGGSGFEFDFHFPWDKEDCTPFDLRLWVNVSGRLGVAGGGGFTLTDLDAVNSCDCQLQPGTTFDAAVDGTVMFGPFAGSISFPVEHVPGGGLDVNWSNHNFGEDLEFGGRNKFKPGWGAGFGGSVGLGATGSISISQTLANFGSWAGSWF